MGKVSAKRSLELASLLSLRSLRCPADLRITGEHFNSISIEQLTTDSCVLKHSTVGISLQHAQQYRICIKLKTQLIDTSFCQLVSAVNNNNHNQNKLQKLEVALIKQMLTAVDRAHWADWAGNLKMGLLTH